MIQRQKDAVFTLGSEFSIKHPLFALLVRHSEWILNHVVRNDFLVELDNRVIKTSPYESHTGNLASRSTSLLNRILVGRRDDDEVRKAMLGLRTSPRRWQEPVEQVERTRFRSR